MIVQLIEKYGPKKWSTIARFLPGRIGKQCRERYAYRDSYFSNNSVLLALYSFCPLFKILTVKAVTDIGGTIISILP